MEGTINVLELFAGVGGLASQWLKGWRTVCYVEWAKYPQEIIKARIRDGLLDDAPIWDDAATFDGRPWRGFVNVIKAGFPCQPFSVAGQGLAGNDPRDGWPHTIRIIREVQPRWVYLENVPGLLAGSHGYFGRVLRELAQSGYDARWRVLSAAELGAPHRRDRVWILATNTDCNGGSSKQKRKHERAEELIGGCPERLVSWSDVADATSGRREQVRSGQETSGQQGSAPGRFTNGRDDVPNTDSRNGFGRSGPVQMGRQRSQEENEADDSRWPDGSGGTQWSVEPELGRVAHGVANRVDRLKAIGNGEVPAVAAAAWDLLVRGSE